MKYFYDDSHFEAIYNAILALLDLTQEEFKNAFLILSKRNPERFAEIRSELAKLVIPQPIVVMTKEEADEFIKRTTTPHAEPAQEDIDRLAEKLKELYNGKGGAL